MNNKKNFQKCVVKKQKEGKNLTKAKKECSNQDTL